MTFDWTLNIGSLATVIAILFAIGVHRQKFVDLEIDVREIKEDLRAALHDEGMIKQTLAVHEQRLMTCEHEQNRNRDDIHKISVVVGSQSVLTDPL